MRNRGQRQPVIGLTVAVAVAGILLALSAGAALAVAQHNAAEDQLDKRTSVVADAVASETGRYVDTLQILAAAIGANAPLTADSFAHTTDSLHRMRLAGASAIAFLVPATDAELRHTQATWRARGATGLVLDAKGSGREHIFSIFGTRLDGSGQSTAGVDVSELAVPAAALTEARRSGRVAVSDTFELLRDQRLPAAQRQLSFALAVPVYEYGSGHREFTGWLLMSLRGQNFIGRTITHASEDMVDITLRAQNADQATVAVARLRDQAGGRRDLRSTRQVTVANRRWQVVVEADGQQLPGGRTSLPTIVTLAGMVLSALLAGLVYVLGTGRARAQEQVRAATADLAAAEAESRRQAELLSAVLEGISDGVAVVDADGEFLLHNPAAKAIVGLAVDRGGAENWQSHYGLFQPDGVTPFETEQLPIVRALRGEPTEQVEVVVRNAARPDGVAISVSARPLAYLGQKAAVAVFHDISAHKQAEAELRGFAGVVAHDLKSPLTAVRGYAELAASELEHHDGHARRSVERILVGAERMQRLITDLLNLTTARDATLCTTRVDLRELVDEVVAARVDTPTRTADGERRRPDIYVSALPAVQADPVLVRQVLDNLVGNAMEYTPPGQLPRIDVTASTDSAGWVHVQVADRGIGIPAGEHVAVFDAFHRAANGSGSAGTGLGLAICKRIVERHGGRIVVADNPGGGALFTFTLPAAQPAAALEPAAR